MSSENIDGQVFKYNAMGLFKSNRERWALRITMDSLAPNIHGNCELWGFDRMKDAIEAGNEILNILGLEMSHSWRKGAV